MKINVYHTHNVRVPCFFNHLDTLIKKFVLFTICFFFISFFSKSYQKQCPIYMCICWNIYNEKNKHLKNISHNLKIKIVRKDIKKR